MSILRHRYSVQSAASSALKPGDLVILPGSEQVAKIIALLEKADAYTFLVYVFADEDYEIWDISADDESTVIVESV